MSDFFADLRRDLMDAAERDNRTPFLRRLRMPWRPVFALAGAALAAAAFLTVAATLSTEAERDVAPPAAATEPTAGVCAGSAIPPEVRETFGIFRRERAADDELPKNGFSAPGTLFHADESRRAATTADGAIYLVPAKGCSDDGAEPLRGGIPGPGVCVVTVVQRREDGPLFCEGVKETMFGGVRYVEHGDDGRRYMVKAVPDHVERASYTDGTTSGTVDVNENLVLADLPRDFGWKKLTLKFQLAGKDGFELAPMDVHVADLPSDRRVPGKLERADEPSGGEPCGSKEAAFQRPVSGAVPESLRALIGVLRRDATAADRLAEPYIPSPQVVRFYEDGTRLARTVGDVSYFVTAAEIVPRERVDERKGGVCAASEGPGEPGICLTAVHGHEKGAMVACFTVPEMEDPGEFLDRSKLTRRRATVAGLAPDGVRAAVFDVEGTEHVLDAENNVYAGEFPATVEQLYRARVTFRR